MSATLTVYSIASRSCAIAAGAMRTLRYPARHRIRARHPIGRVCWKRTVNVLAFGIGRLLAVRSVVTTESTPAWVLDRLAASAFVRQHVRDGFVAESVGTVRMVRLVETLEGLAPTCSMMRPTRASNARWPTYSAHTASPRPLSRTPAGSRASTRHASLAPRTMSAHGPLAWAAPRTRTHRSVPAPPTPAGASRLPRAVPYPTPV